MTQAINHTRLVAFRRCRRFHKFAYFDGIRSIKKTLPLLFGEAWHAWLEHWLGLQETIAHGFLESDHDRWIQPGGMDFERAILEDLDMVDVDDGWNAVRALDAHDPYEAARFRALALAYHLRWRKQDWRVLAVERKYEAPLVNPETGEVSDWAHRDGRIDAIVEIDGEQMLVENKSHEGPLKPGDPYFAKLRMDSQLSQYWIGAKSLGYDPQGIIYDVACKPSLEPLKATPEADRKMTQGKPCKICKGTGFRMGRPVVSCDDCMATGWKEAPRLYATQRDRDETVGEFGMRCFQELVNNPDSYFHRVKVVRLEHEMREFELSDWQTVEQMRREHELEHYPLNTDACWQYNRACDYWPSCSMGVSLHDETLYRIRKRNGEAKEDTGTTSG